MISNDVLVSLAIIAAVLITLIIGRRDGRANPVNTRKLQSDMARLSSKVSEVTSKVEALEGGVEEIREDMRQQPSKADIARLEERMKNTASKADTARIEESVRGVAGHVENVDNAVVRMENLLLGNSPVAQIAAGAPSGRRK